MTDTLQKIREKCIEANPERGWCGDEDCRNHDTIRLADVLLAIGVMKGYFVEKDGSQHSRELIAINALGHILGAYGRILCDGWNLRNDDLEAQSPETVEFIGKVLNV